VKLSSKAIELINTHELTAELMARGWSVYLPVYDDGIDMLATRADATEIIRIQLKSRWTIQQKYLDRPIEMAFKDAGAWFLVPHETMVEAAEAEGYCSQPSWTKQDGAWSVAGMSQSLRERMLPYSLDQRLGLRQVVT
jgi:hypothetical protein